MESIERRSPIRARFILAGFECPPSHVTALLGLEPDKAAEAGEVRQRQDGTTHVVKDSYWELAARTQSLCVEDYILELLDVVEPHGHKIDEVPGYTLRKFDVAVYVSNHQSNPSLSLEPGTMSRAAKLNVEIDVAFYHCV